MNAISVFEDSYIETIQILIKENKQYLPKNISLFNTLRVKYKSVY